ncbi:GntR family transcriptional regulator [Microbacterium sp. ZW CA_36]|uniref:GntR family transcriptional regulator n=1 Tax=Microbacterium sp. ZW CA_36 TaxID=3378078 RepID=UPI0038519251
MAMKTMRTQAVDALREIIQEQYRPGEKLPAEPDLAKQLSLSRNTIREAIAQLVHEGRLDRKWGVGTTVLSPRAQAAFSVTDVGPIRQIIEASGHQPGLLRFHTEVVDATDDVAAELELEHNEKALYIERLFAVDTTPAVWLRDWCRTHVGDTAIDVSALEDISVDLPTLFREQTGQVLDRLEGRIDAVARSGDFATAGHLDTPLVQISQNVVTSDDLSLVYSIVQFDTAVVDLNIHRQFGRR